MKRTLTLFLVVAMLMAGGRIHYRPKQWMSTPVQLAVVNWKISNEPIVAAHAIRWREIKDDSGLQRATIDWQVVLEIANVSRYEMLQVGLSLTPTLEESAVPPVLDHTGMPLPRLQTEAVSQIVTTTRLDLTIERGEPMWIVADFRLNRPVPVRVIPKPTPTLGRKADKPTIVIKPPPPHSGPVFQDIRVTVLDFRGRDRSDRPAVP